MKKSLENIIIDSDVRNVFMTYYSKDDIISNGASKLFRCTSEKLPCSSGEVFAKDTNALYMLNRCLAKIVDNKQEYKQIKIYLNKSLYNKIVTGKYKYWVENGMTQTGTPLASKELEQWKIFVRLYKEVFTKINWYNTDLFNAKTFQYCKEEMEYGRIRYNELHKLLLKKKEEDCKKLFNKM